MNNTIQDASKKNSWQIFDRIAKTYDPVNRLLSFGLDKKWRRKVSDLLPSKKGLLLLDLATGTAEQIILLCQINSNISNSVGIDLSQKMLDIGEVKIQNANLSEKIQLKAGDAVSIPSEDSIYDAVTISFGIRNVPDVQEAILEMYRVLNSGGKALVLEFSIPSNPIIRWGHLFYLRNILPLVGGFVSGDYKAYRYLNTSIEAFPYGEEFCQLFKNVGFKTVRAHPVSFGIATIYEAIKE
jgi:demethylmenaquinone methyltransferase / 2-methoxy-6-polyprenyl-1,4-benzoquinol methylase